MTATPSPNLLALVEAEGEYGKAVWNLMCEQPDLAGACWKHVKEVQELLAGAPDDTSLVVKAVKTVFIDPWHFPRAFYYGAESVGYKKHDQIMQAKELVIARLQQLVAAEPTPAPDTKLKRMYKRFKWESDADMVLYCVKLVKNRMPESVFTSEYFGRTQPQPKWIEHIPHEVLAKLPPLIARVRAVCQHTCAKHVQVMLPCHRTRCGSPSSIDGAMLYSFHLSNGKLEARPLLEVACGGSHVGGAVTLDEENPASAGYLAPNLIKWAKNPRLPAKLGRKVGKCAFCSWMGSTVDLDTAEGKARGFGNCCAYIADMLMAPLALDPPAPMSIEQCWAVLKTKSTVLTDEDGLGLETGALLPATLESCKKAVAETPLDSVVRLLADSLRLGWQHVYVPPGMLKPFLLLVGYLGISPEPDLLKFIGSNVRLDLGNVFVAKAEAAAAVAPSIFVRKRKTA